MGAQVLDRGPRAGRSGGESREAAAAQSAKAGRELEIFLDRVGTLAAQDSVHHLIDPRYGDLFAKDAKEECAAAEQLRETASLIREFLPESARAAEWQRVLT